MIKTEQMEDNKKFFAEIAAIDRHAIVEKIKVLEEGIAAMEENSQTVPQSMRDQLIHWEKELKKFN